MFDFPASPSLGQAFYAPNGPIYVWDGVTWQAQPGSAVANVLWSDTAPVAPFNGQLWGNSLTGILYSWYVDPNSSQWVAISGGAPASVRTARTRNRVINPTCQVSQENGSNDVTTASTYPADQWYFYVSGLTALSTRVALSPSPEGTATGLRIMATVAKASLAAGDILVLVSPIEGLDVIDLQWGTASAKPAVLRFSAFCETAGTYAFSICNNGSTRTYCGSFTITAASVWQAFSFAIPGDTTGTWVKDTGVGMQIRFPYAVGSSSVGVAGWQGANAHAPPGTTNGAAIANKALYITDVGLYSDPDATGVAPRFEAPSYEDDLARCQRYWNRITAWMKAGFYNGAATTYGTVIYPVMMRATPAIVYSSQNYSNSSGFATNNIAADSLTSGLSVTAAGAFWGQTNITTNARLI